MVHGRKESFKEQLILVLGVVLMGLVLGYSLQLRDLGCFLPFSIGVLVNVTNEGSAPVSNLRISFTGGENRWAKLDPGRAQMFRVKPSGESDVVLSFLEDSGNARSQKVDVYLEKNYHGTIYIKIDRFGKIMWKDDIMACPN